MIFVDKIILAFVAAIFSLCANQLLLCCIQPEYIMCVLVSSVIDEFGGCCFKC